MLSVPGESPPKLNCTPCEAGVAYFPLLFPVDVFFREEEELDQVLGRSLGRCTEAGPVSSLSGQNNSLRNI